MTDKYIFRRTREDKYTIIPNDLIKDTRLSWEARGLLIYLLSKPKEWTTRKMDLERQSQANDFVVSRILDELESHRYMFREKIQDKKGKFDWITYVFDETIPQSPTDGEPPSIVSKEEQRNKATKEDVLGWAAAYSKKGNGLEDYPPDVVPYLDAFINVFKRNPSEKEKGYWIKVVREEWRAIGVTTELVSQMYAHAKEQGTAVKSPASITFAYDEIRTKEQSKEQPGKRY